MTSTKNTVQSSLATLAVEFFQQSIGNWKSQRRYYTLKNGEAQEVVSLIQIQFLAQGSNELIELAKLHQFDDTLALVGGSKVTWESNYTGKNRKPTVGETVFGVSKDSNTLYRDRGFATPEPVTAKYYFSNPKTMCLRTEYDGSVFEEELKLIGDLYRTRQTIISRAGEEIMIGQYLEKRVD